MRILPFFFILLLVMNSCDEETNLSQPDIPSNLSAIYYDDGNIDAPILPPGSYEAAAKFTQSQLALFENKEIKQIHFFTKELPNTCKIKIYSSFTGQSTPTNLLYSKNVISEISAGSWNVHEVDPPIIIGQDDIWVSVAFESNVDNRIVGCDPGPADTNGDWIWDGSWDLLRNTSTLDINWNIRLAVDPS